VARLPSPRRPRLFGGEERSGDISAAPDRSSKVGRARLHPVEVRESKLSLMIVRSLHHSPSERFDLAALNADIAQAMIIEAIQILDQRLSSPRIEQPIYCSC
jgi:hypothetical protein